MRFLPIFTRFYKHRDLIIQLTKRELEIRHKGSKLGHIWAILSPLMMLSLYLFIFGVVFQGKFGVLKNENFFDFALALFLGLSLFNVIAETINTAPLIIVSQPNFVKKVVFPLEIIPLTKLIASLYHSMLSVFLCILLAPLGHGSFTFNILLLPILIIPLMMLGLGLSWGIAAVGVFLKDINHVTGFIASALMYASAIVYSPTRVPERLWNILKLNPIPIIVNQSRTIILWNGNINYRDLLVAYISSFIILILGYSIFAKLRPSFAENV